MDEALKVPLELKKFRFARIGQLESFVRFLLNTVPGSYKPDPDLGCRSPYFTPEYSHDIKNDVHGRIVEQFERYLGITVHVTVSDEVQTVTAFHTCRIVGRLPNGERFNMSWEI